MSKVYQTNYRLDNNHVYFQDVTKHDIVVCEGLLFTTVPQCPYCKSLNVSPKEISSIVVKRNETKQMPMICNDKCQYPDFSINFIHHNGHAYSTVI